jgi:phosphoribosylanthranilate isomerase
MFRIKICGVTSVDDARLAIDAGADALGLNFYPASPRVCSLERAREITRSVGNAACKVGVFVNAPALEIRRAVAELGLNLVQLHGDEPPEYLAELRGIPVMRAFRPGDNFDSLTAYLRRSHTLACLPRMVLIDACARGAFGGTGQIADWQAVRAHRAALAGQPLVLAGGLNASNVAAAIAAIRPWAVDAASGVEERPGQKSAESMRAFVAAARAAFAQGTKGD